MVEAQPEAVRCGRPAHQCFSSVVAEIVLANWEIEHFRCYGVAPQAQKSSIAGKYQWKVRDFFDEMTVVGEVFRWDKAGWLISAPVMTEEEWISWIQRL